MMRSFQPNRGWSSHFVPFVCTALLLCLGSTPLWPQDCLTGGRGATLLYPYFEVDIDDPSGTSTLISLTQELNSSERNIVRVVLWTDWAIPTLAFDVYLEGFDVQTINVRDLFNGTLPVTGVGVDLSDIQGCAVASNTPVAHNSNTFDADEIERLRESHLGLQPYIEGCRANNYGDGLARGYITVDVVDQCSGPEIDFIDTAPDKAGYFSSVALDKNVLHGDWFIITPGQDSAQGYEAVSIWSDPVRFTGPDEYTFYGRYVGWDGSDHRVPLANVWASRYFQGGAFDGGTEMIVWRDTKEDTFGVYSCVAGPPWRPLVEDYITGRSEDTTLSISENDSTFFALATQKVSVSDLSPSSPFGRIQTSLNQASFSNKSQGWIGFLGTALGRYSVGLEATPVFSTCGLDPTP